MMVYISKSEREVLLKSCDGSIACERMAQKDFPEAKNYFKENEKAWISLRKKLRKKRK